MAKRADLSRIRLLKRREGVDDPDTFGVVDTSGGARELNIVSETLKGAPVVKRSQTARSDQLPGPTRKVAVTGAGPINVEVYPGAQMDEFIEEGVCNTFSTPLAVSAATIAATASDNSLNGSGGSEFAGVQVGSWVRVLGFATVGNNTDGASGRPWGALVVSKPTNAKIILAYHTLVDEVEGATVTVTGKNVRNGTKVITSTYERHNTDFTDEPYQAYPGQVVNQFGMTFNFEEIITSALNLIGKGPLPRADLSVWNPEAVTAAESLEELVSDASNHMRAFRAGGVLDGNVKMFDFQHAINAQLVKAAQTRDPIGVSLGTKGLTGNLNGYLLESDGRPATAYDHEPIDLHVQVVPPLSTAPIYVVSLPRVRFTDMGDVAKTANEGPAGLDLPFEAERDPTLGYWLQVCSLPRA